MQRTLALALLSVVCLPSLLVYGEEAGKQRELLDRTVGIVDKQIIWLRELHLLSALDKFGSETPIRNVRELTRDEYSRYLEEAIQTRIVGEYLAKLGGSLATPDESAMASLARVEKGFSSKQEMISFARVYGISVETLRRFVITRARYQSFISDLTKKGKQETWLVEQKKRLTIQYF